jgi:hypothetical protein
MRPSRTWLAVGYSGGINQDGRHSSYSTNIGVSVGAQALVSGAPAIALMHLRFQERPEAMPRLRISV